MQALKAKPSILLRPMTSGDLDEVMSIEESSYPVPWSRGVFQDTLLNKRNECWLMLEGNRVCGYAIVSHILDETHLLNLCVSPDFAGQGIGRAILRHLIHLAVARKSITFFLEVRISNKAAINLYHSEGFNEVGVRRNYYPTPSGREDAILMTLELAIDQYV